MSKRMRLLLIAGLGLVAWSFLTRRPGAAAGSQNTKLIDATKGALKAADDAVKTAGTLNEVTRADLRQLITFSNHRAIDFGAGIVPGFSGLRPYQSNRFGEFARAHIANRAAQRLGVI